MGLGTVNEDYNESLKRSDYERTGEIDGANLDKLDKLLDHFI